MTGDLPTSILAVAPVSVQILDTIKNLKKLNFSEFFLNVHLFDTNNNQRYQLQELLLQK